MWRNLEWRNLDRFRHIGSRHAGGQAGRQAEDPTASLSAFGTVRAQGYLLFYDSVEADETSSEPEPEPEPEG